MEASTLPPFAASLSQWPRKSGQGPVMPPSRSSPITVDLPSTMYRPNSGPPLAPISLLPVQDTTGYITDRRLVPSPGLAKDGRPLPPILTYLVRWTDAPAARNLVPVKEILDYVSPMAVEEFERKFEAELDEQRARKEAEKAERRRLKAAAAAAGAPAPALQGKAGKKKRGRPPKHKANDIAPITAEDVDDDVPHKKFRPGSMSLSTPKKSRAMTIPIDSETGDGTQTPLDYADDYDELAGEPMNGVERMEMGESRPVSRSSLPLQESALDAASDGPGGVEDDDESDSGDENYLEVEVRNPESMSYEQTPLHETDDEILVSVEETDDGLRQMEMDTETVRNQSRDQAPRFWSDVHDVVDTMRQRSKISRPPGEEETQEHKIEHQHLPAPPPVELYRRKRTPVQNNVRKQPSEETIQEREKVDKTIGHENATAPKKALSFDFMPVISRTPVPLPVIPGMKKAKPKETPVPLPFLPGMQRSAAASAATNPIQTPSPGLPRVPQAKLASCRTLPSLRPPSFSSQRSPLHRWITETPVPPPVVPKISAIKSELQQPSSAGIGLRDYGSSSLLAASDSKVSTPNSLGTGSTMIAQGITSRREEITEVGYEEHDAASSPPPPEVFQKAPRKRKRQSMRGLAPIDKDEDGEEFWEVKVVIDHKDHFNDDEELVGREYLVVWEGNWPLTWESEGNFVDQTPVTQYWNRRAHRKRALFKRYRPHGKMIGTSSRFYEEGPTKIEMTDDMTTLQDELRLARAKSSESNDTPGKRRRSSRMTYKSKVKPTDDTSEDGLGRNSAAESDNEVLDTAEEGPEEHQRPITTAQAGSASPAYREPPGAGTGAVNAIKATLGWPFRVASS